MERVDAGQGEEARIDARMVQGQTTRFYLTFDTKEGPVRLRVESPSRDCADLKVGGTVHIVIDPANAYVFATQPFAAIAIISRETRG